MTARESEANKAAKYTDEQSEGIELDEEDVYELYKMSDYGSNHRTRYCKRVKNCQHSASLQRTSSRNQRPARCSRWRLNAQGSCPNGQKAHWRQNEENLLSQEELVSE